MASKQRQLVNAAELNEVIAEPRVQAWAQLANVYHVVARRLDQALEADGLTLAQFEILARLHLDGAISQNLLAQRLLVTKGNISGLLNRMARAGLVVRQRDRADKRIHRLGLTVRGRQMFARTLPRHVELIFQVMQPLKRSELKAFNGMLARLPSNGDCGKRISAVKP